MSRGWNDCRWPARSSARARGGAAAGVVSAAQRFLSLLDEKQKSVASFPFNDPIKPNWHNLPPQMNTRAGVRYSELTPEQRDAGTAVLRAVLSPYGYQKVQDILAADKYLGEEMGVNFPTGPDAYMLAIFGTPSATAPWGVQFNGHHLGVNVTIVGSQNVLAPTLTAAYPNIYQKDGKTVFVLADEANRALKLAQSLDQTQRGKAVANEQIWNFLLGPGHDGEVIQPEGLKGSEMSAAQREMMLDVAAAWVNIVNDATAKTKLAEVRAALADTYFLWSGDLTRPGYAYFRVQGPTVHIEYSPQTAGGPGSARGRGAARGEGAVRGDGAAPGDGARGARGGGRAAIPPGERQLDATHVHTVYRDFTNDYGKKFITAR